MRVRYMILVDLLTTILTTIDVSINRTFPINVFIELQRRLAFLSIELLTTTHVNISSFLLGLLMTIDFINKSDRTGDNTIFFLPCLCEMWSNGVNTICEI